MAADLTLLAQAGGQSPYGGFLLIGAVFVIMYFLMIRPQQKQLKEHRALLAGLKKGDDVVTQGGVLGRIVEVREKTITLEVASGVKLRVLKQSVSAKGSVSDEAQPVLPEKETK